MTKPKFSGVLGYLQAIVLSNVAGTIASFIVALLIFWLSQKEDVQAISSLTDNALSVSSFLFFVGLTYSMLAISFIVIVFKKRIKLLQSVAFGFAITPGLFMFGSGSWGQLALCYGISTACVFLMIYAPEDTK